VTATQGDPPIPDSLVETSQHDTFECAECGEPFSGVPVYDQLQADYVPREQMTPFCSADHLQDAAERYGERRFYEGRFW